ncbi:MAG TPA: HAD-IA family hydrolase [Terriglobales bacterium]|nr:HAD-IA family hydrolase [Terriglobales bacterium]
MTIFHSSAILFDLDGVLVDSTVSIIRHWSTWAERNRIDPQKVLAVIHGRRTVEVLRMMAPHLDAEVEAMRIEQGVTDDNGTAVVPGALQLLTSLPEDRWCVVTSGTRGLAMSRIRGANLPVPRILVGADDVTKGKPDPEPYLRGAKLLGMRPADCLVIEDAPLGITAAHEGGMKAIGLTTTFPESELLEADAVVKSLTQIQVRKLATGKLEITLAGS